MPIAFITGISGQDGSYLARFLLEKGYSVHGLIRRNSCTPRHDERLGDIEDKLHLHYGDMSDGQTLNRLLEKIGPEEIYNLAAQSHVHVSFENPIYTADVTGVGAVRLFEAVHNLGLPAKIYQAGSSEMFGLSAPPQHEQSPFHPRSVYACAKVFAHHAAIQFREAYGMFICNGILFNHESEVRGENFVTRKITKAVAAIRYGTQKRLELGNIASRRDWGHAEDYVRAMWLMLRTDKPDDYVVATGQSHSVEDFLTLAFHHAGMDWRDYTTHQTENCMRPSDVPHLYGDPSKARSVLGWEPKVTFKQLVIRMTDYDLNQYGVRFISKS